MTMAGLPTTPHSHPEGEDGYLPAKARQLYNSWDFETQPPSEIPLIRHEWVLAFQWIEGRDKDRAVQLSN